MRILRGIALYPKAVWVILTDDLPFALGFVPRSFRKTADNPHVPSTSEGERA